MNAHTGNKLSVAIAQNGIFLRDFAATTYAGSGFGGGGGAASTAIAGAADEVAAFATSFDAGASPVGVPPSSTVRRSFDRLRR
mgnify:CR=1 FL=1